MVRVWLTAWGIEITFYWSMILPGSHHSVQIEFNWNASNAAVWSWCAVEKNWNFKYCGRFGVVRGLRNIAVSWATNRRWDASRFFENRLRLLFYFVDINTFFNGTIWLRWYYFAPFSREMTADMWCFLRLMNVMSLRNIRLITSVVCDGELVKWRRRAFL